MANSKRRKRAAQMALIREIILCIIALTTITFALVLLLKYNAEKKELEAVKQELSTYTDPNNPYITVKESDIRIEEAKEEIKEAASKEAVDDLLAKIKSDLITNNSSIEMIRSLYPDELVIVDDNQYNFFPVLQDLKKNSYDYSLFLKNEEGRMNYLDSNKNVSFGIDVSKFQDKINWSKVGDTDVDFAIIRLGIRGYSEGELFIDETFKNNIEGALKNNIDVSVYFFTQATSDEEAKEEAQFVLDNIEPYNIKYPIALDVETVGGAQGRGNALSIQERTQYAITFLETIKNAGYDVMIYGNLKSFLLMLDMEQLEDYPKWFAGYTDVPYFPYDFVGWQYTDSGSISGISESVDLNIFFN